MGNHEVNCRLCGEDLRGLHGGHAVGCDGHTYTQPQTKYPGADTSKERLDIVVRKLLDIRGMPTEEFGMLFDLLAMIEERDAQLSLQTSRANCLDSTLNTLHKLAEENDDCAILEILRK